MSKIITFREAWADFYSWAKQQDFWREMDKAEKRRLYDAQADYVGSRGLPLGQERIKSILTKYAPDRYRFEERVILIEK